MFGEYERRYEKMTRTKGRRAELGSIVQKKEKGETKTARKRL